MDGAHQLLGPLTIGLPAAQSIVEGVHYKIFPDDEVEVALSVKDKDGDRKLGRKSVKLTASVTRRPASSRLEPVP